MLISLPGLQWITGLAAAKSGAIHFQMKKAGIFWAIDQNQNIVKHLAHQSDQ